MENYSYGRFTAIVDDIENISDDTLNKLNCGDEVIKMTGNQKHSYTVTYKEDRHGICLTYVDGSGYMETISYDYTGGHWVYNSKDVTQAQSEQAVKGLIRADKDVLSQIVVEYDEDENYTTIIFPLGVKPLTMSFMISNVYTIYYADYNGQVLRDDTGEEVSDTYCGMSLFFDEDKPRCFVRFYYSDNAEYFNTISDIDYILFAGSCEYLNAYNLYHSKNLYQYDLVFWYTDFSVDNADVSIKTIIFLNKKVSDISEFKEVIADGTEGLVGVIQRNTDGKIIGIAYPMIEVTNSSITLDSINKTRYYLFDANDELDSPVPDGAYPDVYLIINGDATTIHEN